jgi:hypothetical protein
MQDNYNDKRSFRTHTYIVIDRTNKYNENGFKKLYKNND